jgi:hypothetical protein
LGFSLMRITRLKTTCATQRGLPMEIQGWEEGEGESE